ncbi:hypothetical protein FOXB_07708 [Fusarium oxysporum f. sp. conglutinans Fo5176]|uniref:Major facilitator superfamily (MFS) profile domain-containing protein n=1 Tax=Fusarium oxysporum (strain Fo5176) TaxID=660025 RepID=F9FMS8_FUSOF|nr:hypothetical protein FOXB_07708 [Fusarium oxysporum f. sp. conglutinans Fo5176]
MMVFALIDVATPTWGPMHEELGYSYEALNNSYAAGCASLAVGACVLIPFALKYGRRPIYIFSSCIHFGVAVWSARQQTVPELMMVNIISCFVGALAEVVVQMTVADVFFVNQRGTMNALFFWSTRVGASLAPMAAGYATTSQGWRWAWWCCAIIFGLLIFAIVFLYEETMYTSRAIEGVNATPDSDTITKGSDSKVPELSGTTTPDRSHESCSVHWIFSGTLISGPLSDWLILFLAKRNHGIYEPEMRLWIIAVFAPFVPIGLILFGVGLNSGWPWPILVIGYGMCSFGTAPAGTIALTYITDAYTEIVGDAMVAVTFTRNICSTMFIFALPPWIAAAGLQNVFITMSVLITAILFGSGIFVAFDTHHMPLEDEEALERKQHA